MKPLTLLAVLLCAAVGASAALTKGITWEIRDDSPERYARIILDKKADGRITLWTQGRSYLQAPTLTAEEAASLGRALLEAAGESRFQSVGVDPRYGPLFYEPESACSLLNRYIAIRQKELADPEISEFYRKVHENEITALRTKIQEKALDGWCR